MSQQATNNPDKTIVQRKVAHEGDKSRQAVRELRAGLGQRTDERNAVSGGFVTDVLTTHSKLQKIIGLFIPVLFCAAAYIAYMNVNHIIVTTWLAIGITLSVLNYMLSRKYLAMEPEQRANSDWQVYFLGTHFLIGITWAFMFALIPIYNQIGGISLVVICGLLTVITFALLCTRLLKFGPVIAATPSVLAVSLTLLARVQVTSIIMMVFLLLCIVLIDRLGALMRGGHISYLKSRAERDQLVMELEASRSISEEARRRAEEANLAKSRFLATMSHELRTPLNAILGFSEVMTNEVMGPINNAHYKEYLGDIHRSGAHLLKLINEILDLSRVEAGRYELNEEATNLAYAAEESQQMIKLKASEKNVNLVMQIQPDLPQIWADARAIRQVILNLLSNALKFTPPGGTIWLKVGWTAGGGQYVSIRDTGPGIPAEEIPIVLSSFGQGSIAIKSAEQGTGLGLPIVQALVHMHDGSFDLKSKLREGTEVIATFPKTRVMEVMPAMPVSGHNETRGNRKFIPTRRKVQSPSMA